MDKILIMNNKLKVTPGKWKMSFDNVLDSDTQVNADGTTSEHNIASISDEHPDYEYNKKAIIAAVNLFKSIDIGELREQKTNIVQFQLSHPTHKLDKDLTGIVYLIDDIQDILVDSFGAEESEVFNFEGVE